MNAVEKILKYLRDEYGIRSKEEFMEVMKSFQGLDVSIFVGGKSDEKAEKIY